MPSDWLMWRDGHPRVRPWSLAPGFRARDAERVEIGRGAHVAGPVRLTGSLYVEPGARIIGAVRAEGRLVLGARSLIAGDVRVGLDLHVLPGATIEGDVACGLELHLHEKARVLGAVHAAGDIVVHGPADTGAVTGVGRVRTLSWPRAPIPS